ncbi:hypothetical protein MICAF_850003 [Microcystis aeruginosa PCC 9807]|uniref:Uncharacterized protein n=1 Tax=Microcystis aeruginosa PCC 9807 TaxID=1160283 RepID=I4HEW8_MICAE|nr:hypothetical protein MICAF_850003 [Microcystis aeruginosa PCC 9807]
MGTPFALPSFNNLSNALFLKVCIIQWISPIFDIKSSSIKV